MGMTFYKYHGLGNDYFVYDCNQNKEELNTHAIQTICDRNFGLGSDGILVGPVEMENGFGVRIYNPDGTETEKSGNGVRIFAKYLKDAGYVTTKNFTLQTLGGPVQVSFHNETGSRMTVSMGKLSFQKEEIGCVNTPEEVVNTSLTFPCDEMGETESYVCTCASIGNPHCIIQMDKISKEKICEIGPYIESAQYFPKKINVLLVQIVDRTHIKTEIYERGAGYTLASGTSCCAAAGAMYKMGLVDPNLYVETPGGTLEIRVDEAWNVFMTGTVGSIGKMVLSDEFLKEHQIH